jgi:hypothetical protein
MKARTSQPMWRRERCFVLPVDGQANGIAPAFLRVLGQTQEASS